MTEQAVEASGIAGDDRSFWAAFSSVVAVLAPVYALCQFWQISQKFATNNVDLILGALDFWGVILVIVALTLVFIAAPLEQMMRLKSLGRKMPLVYLIGFLGVFTVCIPGAIFFPYSANTLFIALGSYAGCAAAIAFPARYLYPAILRSKSIQWVVSTTAILLALVGPIFPAMYPAEYKALAYMPSERSGELARFALTGVNGTLVPGFTTHQAQNPSEVGVPYQMAVGCQPTWQTVHFVAEARNAANGSTIHRMDFTCHANRNGGSAGETTVEEISIPEAGTRLILRLKALDQQTGSPAPIAFVAVAKAGNPW
jgi:hypothetical protein